MAFINVAIIGASVAGTVASVAGSNKAANAQKDALKQSDKLEQAQMAEARRQFDLQREDLAPYREQGGIALGQIGTGTAPGGEFNRKFTAADMTIDPGYEFRRSESLRGLEAGAAARGGALSGGAIRGATRLGSDLASQEFGNAFSRYQTDLGNRYNRLAGVAGVGQQAVNSGNQASQNYTANQANSTNNLVSNAQNVGNVRASQYGSNAGAIAGAANTIGGLFSGGGSIGGGGLNSIGRANLLTGG